MRFMNKFDELFAISGVTRWSFTQDDIKKSISHFQLGDTVIIPKELSDTETEMLATVKQICSSHIVFLMEKGYCRSYINFDCMKIRIIKRAKSNSGNVVENLF